jgi:iron complex transport system ATP-binding protein
VTPVLELADVTFRRDGKQIIDGISLTVHEGEHWALLGPNGAGKSTLLGFCAAVTFPTSGTVRILGEQMGRVDLARLRHSIGHVNPRHRLQYPLTVREVVLTGITATIDIPNRWTPTADELRRADEMIETVGLFRRADDVWPTLSHGERGRTLIARALISDPRLLLLDEPPRVSTWPRANNCWKPSTRSTKPTPRWPRSWSLITSRSCRPPRRMRCSSRRAARSLPGLPAKL